VVGGAAHALGGDNRALAVGVSRGGRKQSQRPFSGGASVGLGLSPQLALEAVVGEVGEGRVGLLSREVGQRKGDRPMQPAALAGQEQVQGSLASQGVTEGEPIRALLDEELGSDQLFEAQQELVLLPAGEPLEQAELEVATGHRGQREQLACERAELLAAAMERLLDAPRDLQLTGRLALPAARSRWRTCSPDGQAVWSEVWHERRYEKRLGSGGLRPAHGQENLGTDVDHFHRACRV
jgi:hypothetical protein